jgi:hypothetical protein
MFILFLMAFAVDSCNCTSGNPPAHKHWSFMNRASPDHQHGYQSSSLRNSPPSGN